MITNLIVKAKLKPSSLPSTPQFTALSLLAKDYYYYSQVALAHLHKLLLRNVFSAATTEAAIVHYIFAAISDSDSDSDSDPIDPYLKQTIALELSNRFRVFLREREHGRKTGISIPKNHFSLTKEMFHVFAIEPERRAILIKRPNGIDDPIKFECAKQHESLLNAWESTHIDVSLHKDVWYAFITVAQKLILNAPSTYPAVAIITNRNASRAYALKVLLFVSNTEFQSLTIPNASYIHAKRLISSRKKSLRFGEWFSHTISKYAVDWIRAFYQHDPNIVPNVVIAADHESADRRLTQKLTYKLALHGIPTAYAKINRVLSRVICPQCAAHHNFVNCTLFTDCFYCAACQHKYDATWMLLRQIAPLKVRMLKRYNRTENPLNFDVETLRKIETKLFARISAIKQRKEQ